MRPTSGGLHKLAGLATYLSLPSHYNAGGGGEDTEQGDSPANYKPQTESVFTTSFIHF
jgi:hypothetical protein